MDSVFISPHARQQMDLRGATEQEVVSAIREGEASPARTGRLIYRKNFSYRRDWKGRYHETKQVAPIVVREGDSLVVVTVYVFYFGG
jgi:Domain of unknown function (DUF4258)